MSEDYTEEELHAMLAEMKARHRALDDEVTALAENGVVDQLKYARLKKEKLRMKDRIAALEDLLTPDIIA